jgi:hypothetical protein
VMPAVGQLAPRKGRFVWTEALDAIDVIGTTSFLHRTATRMCTAESRTLVSLESLSETDTFPIAVVGAGEVSLWIYPLGFDVHGDGRP